MTSAPSALHERFGVREYGMLDPKTWTATVDVLTGECYAPLLLDDGIITSTVIPGLGVDAASPFGGV